MIGSRLLAAPRHGFRLWYSVVGGIVLWLLHITSEAALGPLQCHHSDVAWIVDAITLVTGLLTALAIAWCVSLANTAPRGTGDADGDESSRNRFLGWFGALTGSVSLLLIIWEGAYAHVLRSCVA